MLRSKTAVRPYKERKENRATFYNFCLYQIRLIRYKKSSISAPLPNLSRFPTPPTLPAPPHTPHTSPHLPHSPHSPHSPLPLF